MPHGLPAVSTRPGDLKGRTAARGGQGGVSSVVRLAYVKAANFPSLGPVMPVVPQNRPYSNSVRVGGNGGMRVNGYLRTQIL